MFVGSRPRRGIQQDVEESGRLLDLRSTGHRVRPSRISLSWPALPRVARRRTSHKHAETVCRSELAHVEATSGPRRRRAAAHTIGPLASSWSLRRRRSATPAERFRRSRPRWSGKEAVEGPPPQRAPLVGDSDADHSADALASRPARHLPHAHGAASHELTSEHPEPSPEDGRRAHRSFRSLPSVRRCC